MKFAITFVLIGLNVFCSCQSTEPQFLVPFNDHGLWGFSDTLGNIEIEPTFVETSKFYKKRINQELFWVSNVLTEHGKNRYSYSNGLLLPDTVNIISIANNKFVGLDLDRSIYQVSSGNKYGLFHHEKGYLLPAIYDTIISSLGFDPMAYLVKLHQSDSTYSLFLPNIRYILPTSIQHVTSYKHRRQVKWIHLAKDGQGQLYYLDGYGLHKCQESILEDYEVYIPKKFEFNLDRRTKVKGDLKNQPSFGGELINYVNLFRKKTANNPGYSILNIVKRKNRMGVVNEKGITIVPFEFDEIHFLGDGRKAELINDGLVGRKLFTSNHPFIEPKYTKLKTSGFIKVTPTWSFALFEVEVDGRKGFVGENGVEFYKFD